MRVLYNKIVLPDYCMIVINDIQHFHERIAY